MCNSFRLDQIHNSGQYIPVVAAIPFAARRPNPGVFLFSDLGGYPTVLENRNFGQARYLNPTTEELP